mmetsp:Transcript_8349/g.14426  ORF Transcript_8349/g.14426 Transcript_8349/m.14426 type:complete len:827 (+) Transcript_8349:168-2648(+)|eukprot:CAMPEP_0168604326 /NCGR_PEP_ID=MMETSP0420-20121227/15233_1 /TAXON_ID=498008 /ORGANISM="Pessonella sp." /LENGTH=826 /DNA_ID=CAMNT_0008643427 /DNA_START=81 /DNA_END=2561 /DNA_ORIENTATION=-
MSFWRTFGFHTVSAIDTILDKDEFTLEELLDEEEILQEVKSQNKRLLDFLTQPDILKVLIQFITVEPNDAEEESKRRYKYPFLACEILCSDVWTICDAVYKDPELVQQLYSFLQQPPPLNHQLANYVCRAAGVLLQRKISETVDFMKDHGMIDHFIAHLNNASVMDLLLKVISCEETSEGNGILDWLCETELVPCLVSKFSANNTVDVHENAAQALVDIISVSGGVAASPLIRQLESEPIVKTLFDAVLTQPAPSSALLHGLTVVIELLARSAAEASHDAQFFGQEPAAPLPAPLAGAVPADTDAAAAEDGDKAEEEQATTPSSDDKQEEKKEGDDAEEKKDGDDAEEKKDDEKKDGAADDDNDKEVNPSTPLGPTPAQVAEAAQNASAEAEADSLPPLYAATLSRLEQFADLLKKDSGPKRMMSTGVALEPFGFEKLKILEFFAMVVRLNCAPIDRELIRLDFFTTSMEAFFKYTWNNFLHATVEQIIGGVLESDNLTLQLALVRQTNLPKLLVDANRRNEEEEAKARGVRLGYMGHVTTIAVRLQQAAARSSALAVAMDADETWSEYVSGALLATRTAETKPLGGHRPMGGPGESSDEDEVSDDDLDDEGDSIFDRYQQGFGTEEFGDDDDERGFEMYEDGSDESGEEGDWPRSDEGSDEGAEPDVEDVEALVAEVEAAGTPADPQTAAAADDDADDADAADGEANEGDESAAADDEADTKAEPAAAPAPDTDAGATADAAPSAEELAKVEEDDELSELKSAFDELDADKSGHLSTDEIKGLLENMDAFDTPEKVSAAIEKADADKDGNISFEEFVKLATSGSD